MKIEDNSTHRTVGSCTSRLTVDYRFREKAWTQEREVERLKYSSEAAQIVRMAVSWAPYGGPPPEDVFQQFGLTTVEFTKRLWLAVKELDCGIDTIARLSTVYPRRPCA